MGGDNSYPFPAAKLRKIFKMDAKTIKKGPIFRTFLDMYSESALLSKHKEYSIKFPSSEECY